jgi:hypothetical protein
MTTFVLSRVLATRSGQAEEQKSTPALSPEGGPGTKTASPLPLRQQLTSTLPCPAEVVGHARSSLTGRATHTPCPSGRRSLISIARHDRCRP